VPTTILQICAAVIDESSLPVDGVGIVQMGDDYTVGLSFLTSTPTITATAVQGVAVTVPVATWSIPL